MTFDSGAVRRFIDQTWADSIVPALIRYIAIPNVSPVFDAQWREHGHMQQAVDLVVDWIRAQGVAGLALEVVSLEKRTPLILAEIAGSAPETVLLYGHLDKQPPFEGWEEGLGPWTPVIRDGKLYGRGGADDGYSAFAAITAIRALQQQGVPHARCVVLIEACEESGSFDLPFYIERLKERIGTPSLVIALDSGCGDYERLWMTTSLRGLISANLTVSTLTEGVHSGGAGGIVPSSFRVLRQLLSRLEDERTGEVLPRECHVEVPEERLQQIAVSAAILGDSVYSEFPFQPGAAPVSRDVRELILNRTWRPQLEVIGAGGLPPLNESGNVLRPKTAVKLSLRLPPTADAGAAARAVKHLFEHEPPYGAHVRFSTEQGAAGWNAPPLAPWLEASVHAGSRECFGTPACFMGEGGTIPFMAMLGKRFPAAQFLITGVLGPRSNAHGPNEFLHLSMAAKLSACVARVLADHGARKE